MANPKMQSKKSVSFKKSGPSNDVTLSDADVKKLGEQLAALITFVSEHHVPLSMLERRRGTKFPMGGEHVLAQMEAAVRQHGVPLPVGCTADDLLARREAMRRLRPLAQQAAELAKLLSDAATVEERLGWRLALTMYGVMRSLSRNHAGIAASVDAISGWFALGRRPPKAVTPAAPVVTKVPA